MYTISDLENLTGVNRRNIHFYVQQGVLPPADGAGLGARYGEEHLLRLRAIPLLRNRGLRLDEIRERLQNTSARELTQLLNQPQPLPNEVRRTPHTPVAGKTLIRYCIADGVEILVDGGLSTPLREKAAKLIQDAHSLFSTEEGETK